MATTSRNYRGHYGRQALSSLLMALMVLTLVQPLNASRPRAESLPTEWLDQSRPPTWTLIGDQNLSPGMKHCLAYSRSLLGFHICERLQEREKYREPNRTRSFFHGSRPSVLGILPFVLISLGMSTTTLRGADSVQLRR